MLRIKNHTRLHKIFLLLILCLLFGGCKKKEESPNGEEESLAVGTQLLLQMLDVKSDQTQERTTKVIRGDYSKTLNAKAKLFYSKNTPITYEANSLTTIFEEFLVTENQSVKKGDSIARIRYEADPIHLEELKIELKQLEEKAKLNFDSSHNDFATYENEVNVLKQSLLDEIKDYELNGTTDYILAPCSGITAKPEDIQKETILWNEQLILTINDPESEVLVFEDVNSQIRYGMEVSIEVTNHQEIQTFKGKVASGDNLVSKERRTGYAYVKIDDFDSTQYLEAKFKVRSMVIDIKDVLLVEESAVTMEDSKTYITCLENGKRKKVYFVSGGMNDTYYWVLEGLEEGMAALK